MLKLKSKFAITGLAALLVSLAAARAFAGGTPQITTFTVSATIAKSCSVSAGDVSFGIYDPLTAPDTTATNVVAVTCTTGTAFTVALDAGINSSGSYTPRLMSDGTGTLGYNIYTGATTSPGCTGSNVWGDGTGSTHTQNGTGLGSATPVNFTGHGCMVSGENGDGPATYNDTITVTVTF